MHTRTENCMRTAPRPGTKWMCRVDFNARLANGPERFAPSTASAGSHATDFEKPAGFSRSLLRRALFAAAVHAAPSRSWIFPPPGAWTAASRPNFCAHGHDERQPSHSRRSARALCNFYSLANRASSGRVQGRHARRCTNDSSDLSARARAWRLPDSSVKRVRAHLGSGAAARTTPAVIATRAMRIDSATSRPLRRTSVVTRGVCILETDAL